MSKSVALFFGKYFPFHKGHEYYIKTAATFVDEAIICICGNSSQKFLNITPKDRHLAVLRFVEDNVPNGTVHFLDDTELPQGGSNLSKEESLQVSEIWAKKFKELFPEVTHVVTSEEYGEEVANFMGTQNVPVDIPRKHYPISGTEIRNDPEKHWEMMNEYMQKKAAFKVCVYGPESCGKTTLAKNLSSEFKGQFIPEHARTILTDMNLTEDIFKDIAIGQYARAFLGHPAAMIQFCDTDLMITQNYAKHYLGYVPSLINDLQAKENYNFYILLAPTVPWVEDGLRDISEENERWKMFNKLKYYLEQVGTPYIEITDPEYDNRFEIAKNVVKNQLNYYLTT